MRTLAVLLAGLAAVALTVQKPAKSPHAADFRPLLMRPAFARTLSKPILPMLVDLLWLRAINAIGLKDSKEKNLALYEYGVVITELDPRFRTAYEFIGLNIPFAVARNTFVGGDLSCDMFRRGLKVFPNDRTLMMYLGFSLMHHERKFSEASEVFARAAQLPNALPWMGLLATRLKSHSGEAEDALELTRHLLESELEPDVRNELELRVEELAIEVVLQRVDRAVSDFRARYGRAPESLDELTRAGLHDGTVFDPAGGLISFGPDGKATSTSLTRRLEIYE